MRQREKQPENQRLSKSAKPPFVPNVRLYFPRLTKAENFGKLKAEKVLRREKWLRQKNFTTT